MSDLERAGFILVGVCPTCSEVRVRSKIPITSAAECRPENFDGVGEAPAPTGDVPLCHVCTAVLKFTKEESLKPRRPDLRVVKSEEEAAAQEYPAGNWTTSSGAVVTETIFEPRTGERVINMGQSGEREFIVVTDQRIVRVRF